MVNFSANNLFLINNFNYDKANVFIFKDDYTKRTYKFYDYSKSHKFERNIPYCIAGKINNANNQLYLIIESMKIDKKNPVIVEHDVAGLHVPVHKSQGRMLQRVVGQRGKFRLQFLVPDFVSQITP